MVSPDCGLPMIEPHLLSRANDDSGFVREVLRTGEVIRAA